MKIFILWLKCLPPELYSVPLTTPFRLVCERVSVNSLAQVSSVFPHVVWQSPGVGGWHWCLDISSTQTLVIPSRARWEGNTNTGIRSSQKRKSVLKQSHHISTRNSGPVIKQPPPGQVVEMLPFESAAVGVLIYNKHVWCYHEPLLFGSAASQFLLRKSISVYCSSVCVAAGMLGLCTSVCECINEGLHCCLGLATLSASDVLS